MLAMPSAEWQRVANWGVDFEKEAFNTSADRVSGN